MGSEIKIDWYEPGNIVTAFDQPAYILVETPTSIKIEATMTTETGTVVLKSQTVGAGKSVIQLWSKNPIGNPTATPTVYPIDVNIYTTTDQLIETRKLYWLLVSTDRVIYFKDENGRELILNIMIATEIGSKQFWRKYYGSNIGTLSGIDKKQVVIEAWKEDPVTGKKYYMITTEDKLPSGNISISLTPSDGFTVKVTVRLDNALLNFLYGTPFISDVANFFTNNLVWLVNNAFLPLARSISNALGIKLEISKVEVDTSQTPIRMTIYYDQDINPILLIVIGIGVGALITWLINGTVTEIVTTARVVITTWLGAQLASQNLTLKDKIFDYCKNSQNPVKCVDEMIRALKLNEGDPNLTTITKLNEELNNAKKETEKWKSYVWIAGIGGLMGGLVIAQKPVREYVIEKGKELYERMRE